MIPIGRLFWIMRPCHLVGARLRRDAFDVEVRDALRERVAHALEPSLIARGVPVLPRRQRDVAGDVLLELA